MNEATVALIIMSVLIFLILVGFLVWGIVSGQFKKVEEAKYQIFKNGPPETNSDAPKTNRSNKHVD
jgi:nitrogen fixation-related uncharacterized protein